MAKMDAGVDFIHSSANLAIECDATNINNVLQAIVKVYRDRKKLLLHKEYCPCCG